MRLMPHETSYALPHPDPPRERKHVLDRSFSGM